MSSHVYRAFTVYCKLKFVGPESCHRKRMGSRTRMICVCVICHFQWKEFCKNHLTSLMHTFLNYKWQIFGIQGAVVTISGAQMSSLARLCLNSNNACRILKAALQQSKDIKKSRWATLFKFGIGRQVLGHYGKVCHYEQRQ